MVSRYATGLAVTDRDSTSAGARPPRVRPRLPLARRGRTRRAVDRGPSRYPGQRPGRETPPRLLAWAAKGDHGMHSDVLDPVPSPPDPYPLQGWLFCKCGQAFFRWRRIDSTREYLSLCGCRLWPIDAESIERRVDAAVAKSVQGSIGEGRTDLPAEVFMSLIARIEVGGTVDDVRLIQRT